MTFDEIATLLPGGAPSSAYRPGAWWNNEDDPGSTHSQSRLGWMTAAYTTTADRTIQHVVFRRFAR